MSKFTLVIESDPVEAKSVTLHMEADPPFAKGQTLLTHTLGVSALVRVQQRLLELNPDIVMASDVITRDNGDKFDNTEWARGMHKKLKKITFKKKWWQFWK